MAPPSPGRGPKDSGAKGAPPPVKKKVGNWNGKYNAPGTEAARKANVQQKQQTGTAKTGTAKTGTAKTGTAKTGQAQVRKVSNASKNSTGSGNQNRGKTGTSAPNNRKVSNDSKNSTGSGKAQTGTAQNRKGSNSSKNSSGSGKAKTGTAQNRKTSNSSKNSSGSGKAKTGTAQNRKTSNSSKNSSGSGNRNRGKAKTGTARNRKVSNASKKSTGSKGAKKRKGSKSSKNSKCCKWSKGKGAKKNAQGNQRRGSRGAWRGAWCCGKPVVNPGCLFQMFCEDRKQGQARRAAALDLVYAHEAAYGRKCGDAVRLFFKRWTDIMGLLGRMPVNCRKDPKKGIYVFELGRKRRNGALFIINSVALGLVFLLGVMNAFGAYENVPSQMDYGGKLAYIVRAEEKYIWYRNQFPFGIILSMSVFICVANYPFIRRPAWVAYYYNLWGEATEALGIDVLIYAYHLQRVTIGGFLLLFVSTAGAIFLHLIPYAMSLAATMTLLVCRWFQPAVYDVPYYPWLRLGGGILYIYIVFVSNAYMHFYIFMQRMLKKAFHDWNKRAGQILNCVEVTSMIPNKRATSALLKTLYTEHILILNLMEGVDLLYAGVLETFLITWTAIFCIQWYVVYEMLVFIKDFDDVRYRDAYYMTACFIQSIWCLVTVTISGAALSQEALNGLEVARKQGLMGEKTETQLLFTLSMYASFTTYYPVALTAGRYLYLDKAFVMTMFGFVFGQVVLIIQFRPRLVYDLLFAENEERIHLNPKMRQVILDRVESVIWPPTFP